MGTTIKDKERVYPLYKNKLHAKKECVIGILNELIEKAKISMLMPRFFDEYNEVFERLQDTQYVFCAKDLRAYCKSQDTTKISKCADYRNQDLMQLIDQFQRNYELLKFFPDWLDEISTVQCFSIAEIALLKNITLQRFEIQAMAQVQEEKSLNSIFFENVNVRKGLDTMTRLMRKNRNSLRWRIAAHESIFIGLEADVNEQVAQFKEILEEERKKAAANVNPRLFTHRQQQAAEDLQTASTSYEKTCQKNLQNEYAARAERNKWQIQLQSLLKKYDQTMTEKFREQLFLDEKYAELKAEHEQFMIVYNRSEKVYNDIIRAKEMEEERLRWLKIRAFIENRAARVIQLWYRAHLRITKPELVPKEPKKPKKGKKAK